MLLDQDAEVNVSRSITFLGPEGDMSLTWDESNDEAVKKYVAQKIGEGHSFFIVQNLPFGLMRKKRVRSVNDIKTRSVVVEDKNISDLIDTIPVDLVQRVPHPVPDTRPSRDPDEIVRSHSLCIRPMRGG